MPASQRQIERLTAAIERLASAIQNLVPGGLGERGKPRYPVCAADDGLVSEAAMAEKLGIPPRTLARYRRQGRVPGCWIRNGKRIRWQVVETQEIWKRGIA